MPNQIQPFQDLYQHVRQYDPKLFLALDRIKQNIQTLDNNTSTISGTNIVAQFFKYNITAATLITNPVAIVDGTLLILLLIQDATGHHLITWAGVFGTVPDLGPCDPNTYCTLIFIASAARWWLVGSVLNQAQ